MPLDNITVKGAREHNLKNISVTIPRNKLIVVTGVSGSGKSSLAFDTIYAEGQRRYAESLSAYARQFLGRMDKPDVDYIEGLSPAISIDQKGVSHNPRSTVGTVTEIYDYLRLLFARIGRVHCYQCGQLVQKQTVQQIVDAILDIPSGSQIQIMAPMVSRRKGEHKEIFEDARKSGFVRMRVNGKPHDLSEEMNLNRHKWHTLEIIVDRLVTGDSADTGRLADSVESALKTSRGVALVSIVGGSDIFFSEKFACTHCNISLGEIEPRTFSFNNPHGACPTCTGLGYKLEVDPDLAIPNKSLSLAEGAILPWARSGPSGHWFSSLIESLSRSTKFSTHVPIRNLDKKVLDLLLYGSSGNPLKITHQPRKGRILEWNTPFEGVINNLSRRHKETESDHVRSDIERYMTSKPCISCKGQRLRAESLAVRVGGLNITDLSGKTISHALEWVQAISGMQSPNRNIGKIQDIPAFPAHSSPLEETLSDREKTIATQILKEIETRLNFLVNIGLDYLTLDRTASTLSGGESQRIRLATQIGSGLMGVLYVIDEPSVGLHAVDDSRLIKTLQDLRDLGNTVLVVEHDEAMIRAADHVIDLGPGAGESGGHVIASGNIDHIVQTKASITGQYLSYQRRIPNLASRRLGNGQKITIRGARENNLKNIDVEIPLGMLTGITGVSGSGKSTLVNEVLYKKLAQQFYRSKNKPGECDTIEGTEAIDKVINVDQSPIGRTPRSNPSTYTGTFTPIRELFASVPESRIRGYKPGRFSFNVKGGRCEACSGDGHINIEMQFLPNVSVPCEVCGGKRYDREALEITFKGKNISEVLDMSVSEALRFFSNIPRVRDKLKTMQEVGLGYIQLGQPSTHLSGGEAQRVKLATELSKRQTGGTLYILDEPTTGLSFEDCTYLLRVLHRLVDSGNSVVIIEHHLDLINNADWIIDLGPGAGDAGGGIVAEGTPEHVSGIEHSYTGKYLKSHIARLEANTVPSSAAPSLTTNTLSHQKPM